LSAPTVVALVLAGMAVVLTSEFVRLGEVRRIAFDGPRLPDGTVIQDETQRIQRLP
jgi:hypothetical protein